jgi:hypothetical protein
LPPGLRVVVSDPENDDWLVTLRREATLERTDAQPRKPAGSPGGGQWTSGGGATGGKAEALASIRASAATGKNAATIALQQKLVQRYGVPLAKAAIMYERDIKVQLKAAKAQRAGETADKRAAKAAVDEALGKSLGAMRGAVKAKGEADAKAAADAAGKKAADASKKAERAAKAKATRDANKAKKREAEEQAKKAADDLAKKRKEVDERGRIFKENQEKRAAEDAARAKAKKEAEAKPKRGKATTHQDITATIADPKNAGSLMPALNATTEVIKNYLGPGVKRTAAYTAIAEEAPHEQLADRSVAAYNRDGRVVFNKAQYAALQKPTISVDAAEQAIRSARKQRDAVREQSRDFSRPKPERDKLRTEADKLTEKLNEADAAGRTARAHETAVHVLVHEEFHSFGPMYSKPKLYREQGIVAEEVTTESLSRDVMYGKGAAHKYGAYERQINDVLHAIHEASPEKLGREERFGILITASKAYKRTAQSSDLMDTLHEHLVAARPALNRKVLREQLAKARVPR